MLFIHIYTRNKICTFTHVDVRQMLLLASKLACSYQTHELHAKHTRVLMPDSEEICEHMRVSGFECPVLVELYRIYIYILE